MVGYSGPLWGRPGVPSEGLGVVYEAPPRPPEVESPKSPQSGAALAIGPLGHWAIGSRVKAVKICEDLWRFE